MNATPSAWRNRVFLKIWLASLVSGTAVAAHDTAATWMMNLMSPSGLFISLMASLASLPFFLFTLPAGALTDAFNARIILRLANLWLAGCAGALALLGWAGILNPMLLLVGVFVLGLRLCGQRPGMGIARAPTCHRRRIAISFNSRRDATEYIGYSRTRFGRYSSFKT